MVALLSNSMRFTARASDGDGARLASGLVMSPVPGITALRHLGAPP